MLDVTLFSGIIRACVCVCAVPPLEGTPRLPTNAVKPGTPVAPETVGAVVALLSPLVPLSGTSVWYLCLVPLTSYRGKIVSCLCFIVSFIRIIVVVLSFFFYCISIAIISLYLLPLTLIISSLSLSL